MVAVQVADGPIRSPRCSQQLYKCAQTRWTGRLVLQMTLYVLFLAVSMAAGGMMPWILQHLLGRVPVHFGLGSGSGSSSSSSSGNGLHKKYREEPGYTYINRNTYSYCRRSVAVGVPLQRGYPAPPLSPKGSQLFDAWHHQPVTLKGVTWPGFNKQPPGLEGLRVGQAAMEATDFHAIVYQLKLLGFNTVKLPFSFEALKAPAANQTVPCVSSSKAAWARRASDPAQHLDVPDTLRLPDPSVYLQLRNGSCNSYLPDSNGLGRLMWTLQYLVANGFYVVLSYQPGPGDSVYTDREVFALAWLSLWTPITCLDNFSADIRGRLLLDLINQPSRLGGGLGWSTEGSKPGLSKLYLTAMDGIEGVTPKDALFLLQGSAVSQYWATDAGGGLNAYGLSPGDGFVLDDASITAYQLSDPKPFLSQLLQRPYSNRVLLGPHLLGPDSSGAVLDTPADLVAKMNSSWGLLATEGFCNGSACFRLPVVAGETGSRLESDGERGYYSAVAAFAGLQADAGDRHHDAAAKHLSGWIWSAYSNVTGPGPLLEGDWGSFDWTALRYLTDQFGLNPWYRNPQAWIQDSKADSQAAAAASVAAAMAAAAEAASAVKAGVAAGPRGNFTGTLEKLYERAAADSDLGGSSVLPALADAAAAAAAGAAKAGSAAHAGSSNATVAPSPPLADPVSQSPSAAAAAVPPPAPAPAPAAARPSPAPALNTVPPTAPALAPTPMQSSPALQATPQAAAPVVTDSPAPTTAGAQAGTGQPPANAGSSSSSNQVPPPAPAPQQQPAALTQQDASTPHTAPAPLPPPATTQQPPPAPSSSSSSTSSTSTSSSSVVPAGPQKGAAVPPAVPVAAAHSGVSDSPKQSMQLPAGGSLEGAAQHAAAATPAPAALDQQQQQVEEPRRAAHEVQLPPLRPDFMLDSQALTHSGPPQQPAAAEDAPPAHPPASPPPLRQEPQQQHLGPVSKPGPAVSPVQAPPAGPAPVPAEAIDRLTQMLWDRRLGAAHGARAKHAPDGDYGVAEVPVRP